MHTFEEATRLAVARPADTEQAQYSLPYPVAATLLHGRLDPQHVIAPHIFDEKVLRLADRVVMVVDETLQARFPAEALAKTIVHMSDGRNFDSGVCGVRGDPSDPLSDDEINGKFWRITAPHLAQDRAQKLFDGCWNAATLPKIETLADILSAPANKAN